MQFEIKLRKAFVGFLMRKNQKSFQSTPDAVQYMVRCAFFRIRCYPPATKLESGNFLMNGLAINVNLFDKGRSTCWTVLSFIYLAKYIEL